jgi:hypothetical protein
MAYSYGELNTVAIQKFSVIFENEYQADKRKLMNTTQEIHGLIGKEYVAKFAKPFDLHARGAYHSNIPQTIVDYRKLLVELEDRTALVSSDIFEQALVNASELQNFSRQCAASLVRQQDQIIIDGMVDSTPTQTVTAASNLNLDALLKTKQYFDDTDVPETERYLVATFSQQRSLLKEEKITSSDYATLKALVRGEINEFLGFTFIWIADKMTTGGLPINEGVRKCYAWHRDAIITPYSIEPKVDRDWLAEAQSTIIVPVVRMGSKVGRDDGIILINATET